MARVILQGSGTCRTLQEGIEGLVELDLRRGLSGGKEVGEPRVGSFRYKNFSLKIEHSPHYLRHEIALLTSVKLLIIVQLIYLLIRLFLQLGAQCILTLMFYSGFKPNFRFELEAAKLPGRL
jgi:hypothetical protein